MTPPPLILYNTVSTAPEVDIVFESEQFCNESPSISGSKPHYVNPKHSLFMPGSHLLEYVQHGFILGRLV